MHTHPKEYVANLAKLLTVLKIVCPFFYYFKRVTGIWLALEKAKNERMLLAMVRA